MIDDPSIAACVQSSAVWPWAEANQGFLTVLVFVAAALLTVVEIARAALAETAHARSFFSRLVAELDWYSERTDALSCLISENEEWSFWLERWRALDATFQRDLKLYRDTSPADAALRRALDDLQEALTAEPPADDRARSVDFLMRRHNPIRRARAEFVATAPMLSLTRRSRRPALFGWRAAKFGLRTK